MTKTLYTNVSTNYLRLLLGNPDYDVTGWSTGRTHRWYGDKFDIRAEILDYGGLIYSFIRIFIKKEDEYYAYMILGSQCEDAGTDTPRLTRVVCHHFENLDE